MLWTDIWQKIWRNRGPGIPATVSKGFLIGAVIKFSIVAGPLEELIENHGDLVIEKIEREARVSPKFRKLLCGVWETSKTNIWKRVVTARS